MVVHRRVKPPAPIYTPGWREALSESKVSCPEHNVVTLAKAWPVVQCTNNKAIMHHNTVNIVLVSHTVPGAWPCDHVVTCKYSFYSHIFDPNKNIVFLTLNLVF